MPVSQALDRVKRVLFQPFDLGRWFVIGFCAWLAALGETGCHANFPTGPHRGRGAHGELEQAWTFVLNNLYWIVPLVAALLVLGIVLGVLMTWLSSRGRFMFLHCVALNQAEVEKPWREFARQGNSLFWFRIVLGLISLVVILPLVAVLILMIVGMVKQGAPNVGAILAAIGLVLAVIGAGLIFALIGKLTTDFVVPIMFLRRSRCLQGWSELLGLLTANLGRFALYVLFQIVLGMAIGVLVLVVVLATCCVAGCLMALPYLGTVLLLPVLVFKRAYSLHYLAQYGPMYDVFPPAVPPVSGAIPPVA